MRGNHMSVHAHAHHNTASRDGYEAHTHTHTHTHTSIHVHARNVHHPTRPTDVEGVHDSAMKNEVRGACVRACVRARVPVNTAQVQLIAQNLPKKDTNERTNERTPEHWLAGGSRLVEIRFIAVEPVSYTHLTLPTIYSV